MRLNPALAGGLQMSATPTTVKVTLVGLILACSMSGCGMFSRDAVRSQWQDRTRLPACGEISLSPLDVLEDAGASGIECLRKGSESGQGGELVVHYPTTEGDPLTDYLRVRPDGTTEIYTDSRKDKNSDKDWSYGKCDQPESILDFVC
jgi:hypothetical protein